MPVNLTDRWTQRGTSLRCSPGERPPGARTLNASRGRQPADTTTRDIPDQSRPLVARDIAGDQPRLVPPIGPDPVGRDNRPLRSVDGSMRLPVLMSCRAAAHAENKLNVPSGGQGLPHRPRLVRQDTGCIAYRPLHARERILADSIRRQPGQARSLTDRTKLLPRIRSLPQSAGLAGARVEWFGLYRRQASGSLCRCGPTRQR